MTLVVIISHNVCSNCDCAISDLYCTVSDVLGTTSTMSAVLHILVGVFKHDIALYMVDTLI